MTSIVTRTPSLELLEKRRRTGIDHFDEKWKGEWHLNAAPSPPHQIILTQLLRFLTDHVEQRLGVIVLPQVNLSTPERWDSDFRVPDICVMREKPTAVFVQAFALFEIRSPGDDSYKKMPFYAELGVEAVVIVDCTTKAVQVFRLVGAAYETVPAGEDGWTPVAALAIEMRTTMGEGEPRLLLRLEGDAETEAIV